MLRISSRTSLGIEGLSARPCRLFQVQKNRKPLRCQATTVSGFTRTRAERQSGQTRDSHVQKSRSDGRSLGRLGTERLRTLIGDGGQRSRFGERPGFSRSSRASGAESGERRSCNFRDLRISKRRSIITARSEFLVGRTLASLPPMDRCAASTVKHMRRKDFDSANTGVTASRHSVAATCPFVIRSRASVPQSAVGKPDS